MGLKRRGQEYLREMENLQVRKTTPNICRSFSLSEPPPPKHTHHLPSRPEAGILKKKKKKKVISARDSETETTVLLGDLCPKQMFMLAVYKRCLLIYNSFGCRKRSRGSTIKAGLSL